MHLVPTLYAFIAVSRDGEEELLIRGPDWKRGPAPGQPLIATDREGARRLERFAEHAAFLLGRRIELVEFRERLTVNVIYPPVVKSGK